MLIFMLVIFLGATSWILAQSNATEVRQQLDHTTASAMGRAKEALIGRAASNANLPGSLTCPDVNNDGVADGNFGICVALVGRLPWKTLDVPELRDGNGERLWYALAAKLRDNPVSRPINPLQALPLSIDGAANIAAIIFSAGPPMANQNGRPSNAITDYLDGSNNDGDNAYVSGLSSTTFDDKTLVITREELFRTVNQRVLGEIRGPDNNAPAAPSYGLRRYHSVNGSFPWADSGADGFGDVGTTAGKLPYSELELQALPPPPPGSPYDWLYSNAWLPLVAYERVNANQAVITIGTSKMTVIPCPGSPCP
ncbi:MAG: hypothetical protein ABI478_05995 [Propionivibrio sp.]